MFLFLNNDGSSGGCLDFSIGDLRAGRITLAKQDFIANHVHRTHDGFYFHGVAFLLDFFLRRLLRNKFFSIHHTRMIYQTWTDLSHHEKSLFERYCQAILTRADHKAIIGALESKTLGQYTSTLKTLFRGRTLCKAILEKPSILKGFLFDRLSKRRAPRNRTINPAGARPYPVTVALLGTDGSGKSTLAETINDSLQNLRLPAETIYFGRVRGGLIGNSVMQTAGSFLALGTKTNKPKDMNASARKALPAWSRYIASWLYLVDYAVRHTHTALLRLACRKTLIFDRYSYDLFLMPHASKTAAKLSALTSPSPHIACILNTPASVILTRNNENSESEITRQQDILRELFLKHLNRCQFTLYIDTSVPIHDLSLTISRLVLLLSMKRQIDNPELIERFANAIAGKIPSTVKILQA